MFMEKIDKFEVIYSKKDSIYIVTNGIQEFTGFETKETATKYKEKLNSIYEPKVKKNLFIPVDIWDKVEKLALEFSIAEGDQVTASGIIRRAITEFIDKYEGTFLWGRGSS